MFRTVIISIIIIVGLIFTIFYTSKGGEIIFHQTVARTLPADNVIVGDVKGNLIDGLVLVNVDLMDLSQLPEGSYLKIQRVEMHWNELKLNGLYLDIQNARIKLPQAEPIVLTGTVDKGELDLNIYSTGVTVADVVAYLPKLKSLIPLSGDVDNVDLFITGNYLEPDIKGSFTIGQFLYKGFILSDALVTVDIRLKDIKNDTKLYGHVVSHDGSLRNKRVDVALQKSKLEFTGLWRQPWLEVNGQSKISGTAITLNLRGTPDEPELNLSSEPSYSKEKLMLMLATGKAWQSLEGDAADGFNTAALTKDFVDYFFFAGRSNAFAKRFGISDVSITYDGQTRGISAKKNITDHLEFGYGVEQTVTDNKVDQTSHTIEGNIKVNKNLSVGLEREMTRKTIDEELKEEVDETDNKVLLKYKKSF